MKKLFIFGMSALGLACSMQATADIYSYVDQDGVLHITDKPPAKLLKDVKTLKKVVVSPENERTPKTPATTSTPPSASNYTGNIQASSLKKSSTNGGQQVESANFPRIDKSEQQKRDAWRLKLLSQELENERQSLLQTVNDLGNEKDSKKLDMLREKKITHEKNIEALNKEMKSVRYQN